MMQRTCMFKKLKAIFKGGELLFVMCLLHFYTSSNTLLLNLKLADTSYNKQSVIQWGQYAIIIVCSN